MKVTITGDDREWRKFRHTCCLNGVTKVPACVLQHFHNDEIKFMIVKNGQRLGFFNYNVSGCGSG
jgi:hypothetical protein